MLIKTFLSNNFTRRLDRAKSVDEPALMISRNVNRYGYVLKYKVKMIISLGIIIPEVGMKKYIET